MLIMLKRNDIKESISYQITDSDGSVVNLTGASVNFVMGKKNKIITNNPAIITAATNGMVQYTFTDADTLFSGKFLGEFVVTFPTGREQTFPTNGYIDISIQDNIDTNETNVVLDAIAERQGGFTSKLNSILLQAGNINMSGMNEYTWTATDNQLTYVMPANAKFDPSSKWFEVYVGGIPVTPNLINTSVANKFTLLIDPVSIKNGMTVLARWTEPIVPVTSGHHSVHELNGQDEIDITKLRGYNENVSTQLTFVNTQLADIAAKVKDNGAKGDGSDDTANIQSVLNKGGIILFTDGNYRITDRLLMTDNTTILFSPNARLYMDTNPNGINMLNAYKKQNITIYNANIDGVYGAGTSFPPAGTIEGQGVTLGFYGCKNIKVYGGKFTANGSGSGNVYFSKCKDVFVNGVYAEKTVNGICVDNYYGDNTGPAGDHSENIKIINSTVVDASGRGIAIDLGGIYEEDVYIGFNELKACSYAGISINANGFVLENNVVDGKRDQGYSTVGSQQSLPTYYGIVSELGEFRKGKIRHNKFRNIYKIGTKAINPSDIDLSTNEFKFATSYVDQWDNLTKTIQDDSADSHYAVLYSYSSGSTYAPSNMKIKDNYFENLRTMDDTHIEKCILITDSTNSDSIKQNTDILVKNNKFNLSKANTVIEYYASNQNKYGKFESVDNDLSIATRSGKGIQLQTLDSITLGENKFDGLDTNILLSGANKITTDKNIHKNYNKAYYFANANVASVIHQLLISDIFFDSPSAGNFIFQGDNAGGYIVDQSDCSGSVFMGTNINQLKSCAYPKNLVYKGATAAPTAGYWTVNDLYLWSTVNTSVGQICSTEGNIGTAVFKNYITVA